MRERGQSLALADLGALAHQVGNGKIDAAANPVLLKLGSNDGTCYSNAQVDDYHLDNRMRWHPVVRLAVRARFSASQDALRGTAGFGFWNDPFAMTEATTAKPWFLRLGLPQAVWFFFASPPSDMPLASGVPGNGWKAATIDASGAWVKVLLPGAPFAMLLCRWPRLYRALWPLAQRFLKIDERLLPIRMDEWHDYELRWLPNGARFWVDGVEVFRTRYAPRGPLGMVMWIDNQMMVATPQGAIRHGVLATAPQHMEVARFEVETISERDLKSGTRLRPEASSSARRE